MKVLDIKEPNLVAQVLDVLQRGGIIIYPTETLYGLGCDATNEKAVKKIYQIKGGQENRPLLIVVGSLDVAQMYGEFSDNALALSKKYWPGALTLVVPSKEPSGIASRLINQVDQTIGLRLSSNEFVSSLSQQFGKPIVSTSSNVRGQETKNNIPDILAQLGDKKGLIDLVIDAGQVPASPGSTVARVVDEKIEILRQGEIKIYA